jgi:hypothetical protein
MKQSKQQASERKSWWELRPSLNYWKKSPSIYKEIHLFNQHHKNDKQDKKT